MTLRIWRFAILLAVLPVAAGMLVIQVVTGVPARMPGTHAPLQIAVLLTFALLGVLVPVAVSAQAPEAIEARERLLDQPIKLGVQAESIVESLRQLRSQTGIPICVVTAKGAEGLEVRLLADSLGEALHQLTILAPAFRFEVVRGRVVVYPADQRYDRQLPELEIRDLDRYHAAIQYSEWLKQVFPELGPILPMALRGSRHHPKYAAPVSIVGRGTVIDHLVQLLGDDPRLYLEVRPALTGLPMLRFRYVEGGS